MTYGADVCLDGKHQDRSLSQDLHLRPCEDTIVIPEDACSHPTPSLPVANTKMPSCGWNVSGFVLSYRLFLPNFGFVPLSVIVHDLYSDHLKKTQDKERIIQKSQKRKIVSCCAE